VDLNADLGEAESLLPSDLAILASVTSANIACGFHAGTREVMLATCRAAVERRVVVGAHVSYRDREGFGRRPLDVPAAQLRADLEEQLEALAVEAGRAGTTVAYVKPHGALYHRMGSDPEVAGVVVASLRTSGVGTLLAPPGSLVVELATSVGITVALEAFADRAYRTDGTLVARDQPGAVIEDPSEVARRAVSLVTGGGVEGVDDSWVEVACDSLCVHGDTPGAVAAVAAVREALGSAGVTLAPFAVAKPGPRSAGS
jgi:5-oxoprolinase (ATP-hydrolysing) subunit A